MAETESARRDAYRRSARLYDRFIEPLNAGVKDVALKVDPPQSGWAVLDVGCGTGTGLARYRDAGCRVSGIDVSPAMLAQARERLGADADLRLTTGEDLPFATDAFDLVTISMVLHEVPENKRADLLQEMRRVAKPDGHLLIIDFRFGSLRGIKGRLVKALTFVIERFAGHWTGYRSFRRAGGFPALAAASGLVIGREKIVSGGSIAIYVTEEAR